MSYRISSVAEMTGIARETLLAWERRYGVPTPQRTPGGHRVYADADVQILHRLTELLSKGHRIGEAVAVLRRNSEPERARSSALEPIEQQSDALRDALLRFDRLGADDAYYLLSSWSIRRVIDNALLPILREIGDGWHRGEVSVAQEHFASAYIGEQLITILNRLESGPVGGPLVVCAGYPDEAHEIGLLSVAVKLAMRGWRVSYLGPNLPMEELSGVLAAGPVSLICQSVFGTPNEPDILAHTKRISGLAPASTRLALGGPGVAALADQSTERVLFCPTFATLLTRLNGGVG